ncbi:MAG: O-antigen ligase family protein [Clostridia bacterium]|nr:O-antigen ligase family protein [Clostridia bacterium]
MKREWYRLFRRETAFLWTVLLSAAIPVLPEYAAPPLAIGALAAAYQDAKKRNTTLQIGPVGKLMLVYIAYIAVGIAYSAHPLNSLSTVAMWAVMFCVYLALTTVLNTRRRLHTTLHILGAASAFIGLIACAQYILLGAFGTKVSNQLWLPIDEWFYSIFPMDVDIHMADHRACGTFNNPNILGEYLAMMIPLVGHYAFTGFRTRRTLCARGFVFLMVLGMAASFSRGAYIALLSVVLMILVSNLKRITPLALCLVASVSLIPEAITGRFLSIGLVSKDFAIIERFAAWEVAFQTIISRPLFGIGPGISNFWELLTKAGVGAPHSHNLVLQLLIEGGFVALFLMCAAAIRLLQNNLELANRNRRGSGFGNALVMFVVVFIVYGMVDYPFLSPKLIGTFFIVLSFGDANTAVYLRRPTTSFTSLPIAWWHRIYAQLKQFPPFQNRKKSHN